jgi:hypothetical protein
VLKVTALKRWLGIMGLASIIGFGGALILRDSVAPEVRFALEGIAFLAGAQLFFPWGWRRFLAAAVIFVPLTFVNSLPAMQTPTAEIASWVGIAVVAIVISVFERRRAGRATGANA